MAVKKNKTRIIAFSCGDIVLSLTLSKSELSVLKLALKNYGNGYGLAVLKRIEKEENS